MIIAESAFDPVIIGSWLQAAFWLTGGILTLLGCAVAIKKLTAPVPREEEKVTRGELMQLSSSIATLATKTELNNVEQSAKFEIGRVDNSVKQLEEYTRQRLHELANQLQPMMHKLIRINTIVGLLAAKSGIEVPTSED